MDSKDETKNTKNVVRIVSKYISVPMPMSALRTGAAFAAILLFGITQKIETAIAASPRRTAVKSKCDCRPERRTRRV